MDILGSLIEQKPEDIGLSEMAHSIGSLRLKARRALALLPRSGFAARDGDSVPYRKKVDPPAEAIRLFSAIDGRKLAHSTAVAKLLLSYFHLDESAIRDIRQAQN